MNETATQIKAEDLRVGNYIGITTDFNRNGISIVMEGKHGAIRIDEDFMEVLLGARNYGDLVPIELTPDILKKTEFKEHNGYFTIDINEETHICFMDGVLSITIYQDMGSHDSGTLNLDHIKHLHQLQNFYHSLTGKELEISF